MAEIESMNDHINMAKQEVAALKPVGQDNTSITIATEELSNVVQSTEDAANAILETQKSWISLYRNCGVKFRMVIQMA